MVFLASGQYTLSMRSYAPFRNVVRSNQRHDMIHMLPFKLDFSRTLFSDIPIVIASMRSMHVVFECLDNFLDFSLSSRTSPL